MDAENEQRWIAYQATVKNDDGQRECGQCGWGAYHADHDANIETCATCGREVSLGAWS